MSYSLSGVRPEKISLAPMEGVFDPILRELYSQIGGFDFMITEFIRVTQQLLPKKVFYKYAPELLNNGVTSSNIPVYVQLLGSDPQLLLENAQRAVELGALGIDFNFGCPAKTVNRHDGGATLLKSPQRIFDILNLVRRNLSPHILVSAKVRLGYENKDLHLDIAKAVNDAGVNWITIHARTKQEGYKKPAHWEYIAYMKEVLEIPIFANGDLNSIDDFKKCYDITGCKNICIGRGAFANPHLALELKKILKPKTHVFSLLKKLSEMYIENNLQKCVNPKLKQWMRFLSPNYPEVAKYFESHKRSDILF